MHLAIRVSSGREVVTEHGKGERTRVVTVHSGDRRMAS